MTNTPEPRGCLWGTGWGNEMDNFQTASLKRKEEDQHIKRRKKRRRRSV